MTRHALALAVVLSVCATASSAEITREDFEAGTVASMAELCTAAEATDEGKYAIGFCYGWIAASRTFYNQVVNDPRFGLSSSICPDRTLTHNEVRTLFVQWAADNPDKAGSPAIDGLIQAGEEAFPCES